MSKDIIELIKLNENGMIKSTDLVDLINECRREENKLINEKLKKEGKEEKKCVELKHKHFMAKIKKELEVLETMGLEGVTNFCPSYYINSQNKKQPCYELNRDGMLQMLNSESTIVRYKTVQLIDELEEEVKHLQSENKQLTEIAESDEERAERIRKANIVNYSVYNIKKRLLECDYTNIEATVNKIIEIHANMYVLERDKPYQNTDKYGNKGSSIYVNHIKSIIETKLDEIRPQMISINPNINSIILEINRNLHKNVEKSKNITSGREVNKLKKQLEMLNPSIDKYLNLDVCGFSFNKMYKYVTGNRIRKSKEYNNWLYSFPADKVVSYFKDVNLTKPTVLFTKYVAPKAYDIDNFIKSTQDAVASSLGCNDNKIHKVSAERIGDCKTTDEGKIFIYLRNITDFELKQLKEIEKYLN